MRVKLFKSRNYDFIWPLDSKTDSDVEPIPAEEKIIIHCQRLKFDDKRDVEDSMVEISGKRFQKATSADEVGMSYTIGKVKKLRLRSSVMGWDNVLDQDDNLIKFKLENFYELLMSNADLDPMQYGSLEEDLLEKIEEINSFADTVKVSPENLGKN